MRDISPQSPEERRKRHAADLAAYGPEVERRRHPRETAIVVSKRVLNGVWSDGFIHAGNLAYLSLIAIFPFLILAAAMAQLLGQGQDAQLAVFNVLRQLPKGVATTLREPIQEALKARTGPLLWLGGLVGLWTAASFVETIRDILRRAYGVRYCSPFWEYRLWSILLILVAVMTMFVAFAVSVTLTSVHYVVAEYFPRADQLGKNLNLYRLVPGTILFGTIYALLVALTPKRYRRRGCRKWPGALFITAWWLATVELLPAAIHLIGGYNMTYGSLAGVMITLLFFFSVGIGVVIGAELNAALADAGATALKGEIYSGPYTDTLVVEEPQPGEDVEVVEVETGGRKL